MSGHAGEEQQNNLEPLRGKKNMPSSPLVDKYQKKARLSLQKDLLIVESLEDPIIQKDHLIEKFTEKLFKRYYNWWFYIRGIPRIALPMLITASQRLFDKYYITGCTDSNGVELTGDVCVSCNNDSTFTNGNTMFKTIDFVIMLAAIIALMILVRRAIAEAHLAVKLLKFQIMLRTSWYYWYRILMIVIVSVLCAGLSFISSIFMARINNDNASITCSQGPYQGQTINLHLTDYFDNLYLWIGTYAVSLLFYWPVVNFLIDLYDTPLKIFIEPEDMLMMNGEFKCEDRLLERLSKINHKVRFHFLTAELYKIARELRTLPYFRLDRVPDELLQVALLRLYKNGKVKTFTKKIDV